MNKYKFKMTPHRAQCLQPSLWNCFIATLIAHITNSKLRAMCAFYCPSTFNDPQPKPEIQFHFHLCRCFLTFFAFLFELWRLKYIRNVYSEVEFVHAVSVKFASGVNFSIFTHFFVFFLTKTVEIR